MPDPVSWFLIDAGWKVVDPEGQEIGSVDEVVGDSSTDIFNGLAIAMSLLGKPRYVPAEQVAEITEGSVRLKLTKEQVRALGEFEEPPTTAEILPDHAGMLTRAEARIEAPIHAHAEHMNAWRRLWFSLRHAFRRHRTS